MSKFIEICDTEIIWEWYDSSWHRFDKAIEQQVEQAYQKNNHGTTSVTINSTSYEINFSDMQQMNTSSKYKRNVRRREQKKNAVKVNVEELNKQFAKYKNADGVMDGDGIMAWSGDVNVDPMDVTLLVLFWKVQNENKYVFTEKEFVEGLGKLGLETVAKQKSKLSQLKHELNDTNKFKQFYTYVFHFMKDNSQQKKIAVEVAVETWKLVLAGRYKYLDQWCKFMLEVSKQAVALDTWKMFYDFITDPTFKSFATFDATESAYPTAIEEFLEWAKVNIKQ